MNRLAGKGTSRPRRSGNAQAERSFEVKRLGFFGLLAVWRNESCQVTPHLLGKFRAELHADLDRRGILAPLVAWAEEGIVLDGHNRLAWAQARGVKPPVTRLSFPDLSEAIVWAIKNQLARRNLTPNDMLISWARRTTS